MLIPRLAPLFSPIRSLLGLSLTWIALLLGVPKLVAQEPANWKNFTVEQEGRVLRISPQMPLTQNEVSIPRLFNTLSTAVIQFDKKSFPVQVAPEIDSWKLSWKAEGIPVAPVILLTIDEPWADHASILHMQSDGSFFLPAHAATTRSDDLPKMKLRYEPQPFKNTVGYWVSITDYVTWDLDVQDPGTFNLAILQGCGAGQGGSLMQASLHALSNNTPSPKALTSLEFTVEETGHFQDFHWRHLGPFKIDAPAQLQLQVRVKKLANSAAVDIRAIHLVRSANH